MSNIYGETPTEGDSLAQGGGVINGDLEITQDLQVDGNVVIDGTLTVDTIISDLKIEDPIINLGVNNTGDALNLGILMTHNTNRFAGIVRRATDKNMVVLNSITPEPTNSGVIPPSDAILEAQDVVALQTINAPSMNTQFITTTGVQLDISAPSDISISTSELDLSSVSTVLLGAGRTINWQGKPNQYLRDTVGPTPGLTLSAEDKLEIQSGGDLNITSAARSTYRADGSLNIISDNLDVSVRAAGIGADVNLTADNRVILDSGNVVQIGPTGSPNTYSLPTTRGTIGQYIRANAAGLTSWVDFPSASYGVMSMVGNALPTTFLATGTYTQIVGTRTGSQLADFVFAPNVLQYTGAEPGEFLVNVSQTWFHGGGTPDQFRLAIFVNGVIVASSEQRCNLDSDTDYPRSSSTNAIVSLTNGDQMDVRIANFTDITQATVIDHTTSIIKVGLVASGGGGGNPFDQDLNTTDSPTFAGLTVPTLTAPVNDIDVIARELVVQNPVVGSTVVDVRSNGASDAVLSFSEGPAGRWELYKTVTNDLAISNSALGDDVITISNSVGNAIELKSSVDVNGGVDSFRLPTVRPVAGQLLYGISPTLTGWRDAAAFHLNAMTGNATSTTFTVIGETRTIVGTTATTGLQRGGPWSVIGTSVRYDGITPLANCKIELSGTITGGGVNRIISIRRGLTLLPSQTTVFTSANAATFHTMVYASVFPGDVFNPSVQSITNITPITAVGLRLGVTEII